MLAPSAVCLAFGQLVAACCLVQLSVAREGGREGGRGGGELVWTTRRGLSLVVFVCLIILVLRGAKTRSF